MAELRPVLPDKLARFFGRSEDGGGSGFPAGTDFLQKRVCQLGHRIPAELHPFFAGRRVFQLQRVDAGLRLELGPAFLAVAAVPLRIDLVLNDAPGGMQPVGQNGVGVTDEIEVYAVEAFYFSEFTDSVLEVLRYAFVIGAEKTVVFSPVHLDLGKRFAQAVGLVPFRMRVQQIRLAAVGGPHPGVQFQAVFLCVRHGPAQDDQRGAVAECGGVAQQRRIAAVAFQVNAGDSGGGCLGKIVFEHVVGHVQFPGHPRIDFERMLLLSACRRCHSDQRQDQKEPGNLLHITNISKNRQWREAKACGVYRLLL